MPPNTFSFGYLPDPPDSRDFKFKTTSSRSYPDNVDLRNLVQPIKDQKSLGACTAFATTSLMEFVRNKQRFLSWDASPLFTYYSTRKIENTIEFDSGAYVRGALKSVAKDGIAKEITWPYVIENFTINPPVSAWEEAEKHQALTYFRLEQTEDDILSCLADGYPFVFGAYLYESFMSTQTDWLVHNIVPMPDRSKEKMIGGHCMLAVGYLSAADGSVNIITRNSWGEYVGLSGYHNIPLQYFLDPTLSSDFWTIRTTEKTEEDVVLDPPQPPVPPAPPAPEPFIPPIPQPEPPPEPIEPENIWKNSSTYILIGFGILALLFFLL